MVEVSVIIPTYNRELVIKRAVNSVLNQTFKNFELIIIDDGSTDNTAKVLEDYKNKDDRVSVYYQKNCGVSSARNLGLEKAMGQWIAFLDSDDEWLRDKLEKQLSFAMENPSIPLIHGEEIWVRNGKRVNPKNKHQKFGGHIFEKCLPLCLISPSASFIKRELLLEYHGFDESYPVCEDYDLWLKITKDYEVGFIEKPILIKYGGHEDQLSRKYFAMDFLRVKSLDRVYESKNLSHEVKVKIQKEILSKANILKLGYIKHNNINDLPYIDQVISKYKNLMP